MQKNSQKKAQSAMEFLMTYGWAILAVLVILLTLLYFGILDPDRLLPENTDLGPELLVVDSIADENSLTLLIKNTGGESISDVELEIERCKQQYVLPFDLKPEETKKVIVYCDHDLNAGSYIKSKIIANYSAAGRKDPLTRQNTGRVRLRVDEGSETPQLVSYLGGSDPERGNALIQMQEGTFVATGYTQSYASGVSDVLLVKLDSNGDLLWGVTFGEAGYDIGVGLIETTDEEILITGFTEGYGAIGRDVFLSKFSSEGEEVWTKILGGSLDDDGNEVIETTDGDIIVAGYTYSWGAGERDAMISKFDEDGVEQWTTVIGGAEDELLFSIVETWDNGFVAVGRTGTYPGTSDRVLLLKVDENGNHLWTKSFGDFSSIGYTLIENEDRTLSVVGEHGGDIMVAKFDHYGQILESWPKILGGTGSDRARSVVALEDGGFLINGESSSFGSGATDIIISKINSEGDEEWTKVLIASNNEAVYSLVQTNDNRVALTGSTQTYGGSDLDFLFVMVDFIGSVPGFEDMIDVVSFKDSPYIDENDVSNQVTVNYIDIDESDVEIELESATINYQIIYRK